MFNWLPAARTLLAAGKRFCLVTITQTQGSTPRGVGAKMLVTDTKIYGSIGGGNLEMQATGKARDMLATMSAPQNMDCILGPDMEQCCGGRVKMKFEIYQDMDSIKDAQEHENAPLYVFGAGHVGTALLRALTPLPFDVYCYDNRPEKIVGSVKLLEDVKACVLSAPRGTLYLIMTHDHGLDYDLTLEILRRNDARFCGLIGSKTKRARFLSRLKTDGITKAQILRLTCPIGIEGIEGKQPEIIAASTAAQLLQKLGDPNEH